MNRNGVCLTVAMVSLALLVIVPSLSGAAKGPTYAPKGCVKPRIEPRLIVIACGDGNFYLKVKHWSYWNANEAAGKAKVFANDCIPYCAAGTIHKGHAKVRLTKPRKRTCGGRKGVRMFQKIKFDWKDKPVPTVVNKADLYCVP